MTDVDKIWTPAEILERYAAGERDFRELDITEPAGDPRSFRGAVLDDADFTGAFIVADFTGASLVRAKLRANVKTCCFDEADLRDADFTGARLESTSWRGARMDGADFTGAGMFSHTFAPGERPD
jgi:uncharacterized protein YjbI with pentapeptide repeats